MVATIGIFFEKPDEIGVSENATKFSIASLIAERAPAGAFYGTAPIDTGPSDVFCAERSRRPRRCATLSVDGVAGTDIATHGTAPAAAPCKKISYAINARAAPIRSPSQPGFMQSKFRSRRACRACYSAELKSGIDARSRSSACESLLDGTSGALTAGIVIAADNVTVDGFTIGNYDAGGASFGYGIV